MWAEYKSEVLMLHSSVSIFTALFIHYMYLTAAVTGYRLRFLSNVEPASIAKVPGSIPPACMSKCPLGEILNPPNCS